MIIIINTQIPKRKREKKNGEFVYWFECLFILQQSNIQDHKEAEGMWENAKSKQPNAPKFLNVWRINHPWKFEERMPYQADTHHTPITLTIHKPMYTHTLLSLSLFLSPPLFFLLCGSPFQAPNMDSLCQSKTHHSSQEIVLDSTFILISFHFLLSLLLFLLYVHIYIYIYIHMEEEREREGCFAFILHGNWIIFSLGYFKVGHFHSHCHDCSWVGGDGFAFAFVVHPFFGRAEGMSLCLSLVISLSISLYLSLSPSFPPSLFFRLLPLGLN